MGATEFTHWKITVGDRSHGSKPYIKSHSGKPTEKKRKIKKMTL